MPPPTLQVTLDPDAQAELERRYHTTRDAATRTRYQIVLLNAQGHTPPQVAQLVRCSPDTVRRVLNRYLAQGPDAVPHRPHPGQPPHYPPGWEQELIRIVSRWTATVRHRLAEPAVQVGDPDQFLLPGGRVVGWLARVRPVRHRAWPTAKLAPNDAADGVGRKRTSRAIWGGV